MISMIEVRREGIVELKGACSPLSPYLQILKFQGVPYIRSLSLRSVSYSTA